MYVYTGPLLKMLNVYKMLSVKILMPDMKRTCTAHTTQNILYTSVFQPFFSHVPLPQSKHLRIPLYTKNINDMQFLLYQFNFLYSQH
jgi:hypothetical protein